MSHTNHQYDKLLIFDPADDTVMARAEAPQVTEVTFESFSELTRVIATRDVGIQIAENSSLSFRTQLAEIFQGFIRETIIPARA